MRKECIECNLNQVKKLSTIMELNLKTEEETLKSVKDYLDVVDMNKPSPQVMGEIWQIISRVIKNDNPYKEVKSYYNQEVMKITASIHDIIDSSHDGFNTALKIAIVGNLIDFSAKHNFNLAGLIDKINNILSTPLRVDHSNLLFDQIIKAKNMLYIGDNCGEIVLDKIFIQQILKNNPHLNIYYGVRGQSIVNDVTFDDANEVKMDEVATVISNGDTSQGTILSRTSLEFKEIFRKADVVISKGQGNFEGLVDNDDEKVYFLFMTKCEMISEIVSVEPLSIICLKNNYRRK